jgi:hypothetical protein
MSTIFQLPPGSAQGWKMLAGLSLLSLRLALWKLLVTWHVEACFRQTGVLVGIACRAVVCFGEPGLRSTVISGDAVIDIADASCAPLASHRGRHAL